MVITPVPEESIFSYCSRYHRLSGNAWPAASCMQLFGHHQAGSQHDICPRLDEFCLRTEGALGDPETVAWDRTILPFLLLFKPEAEWAEALATVRGNSVAHLKYRLGALTSGFRANFPLKACPECAAEELQTTGEAYWHLSHQFPTVLICPVHRVSLAEFQKKANGVERFFWHLPDDVSPAASRYKFNEWRGVDRMLELGAFTLEAINHAKAERIDAGRLQATYAVALNARGLLTTSGSLRATRAAEAFCEEMKYVSEVDHFSPIATTPKEAAGQLARTLTQAGRPAHPIRQLIAIQWLFKDWENFLGAYHGTSLGETTQNVTELAALVLSLVDKPEMQIAVRQKLDDEDLSLRQCARDLGVDIKTIMAIAARLGLSIKRRPKKLKNEVRKKLVAALIAGKDKIDLAKQFGISVQTVTTTLQTEPGLSDQWRRARRDLMRQAARRRLTDARKQNPSLGIKGLRMIEPAAYAWLYRNDRSWLMSFRDHLPVLPRVLKSPLDWDARDAVLADLVTRAAEQVSTQHPTRRLSLQDICCRLPELKTKLGVLSRLPQTQRALDQVVRARRKGGPQLF